MTTCTARIWSASGLRRTHRPDQHLEVLVGADPDRVAGELAAPRIGGNRVAGVQRSVGLVRAHLVAMVGEVGPPVGEHRLVRRVAEHVAADQVVGPPVREQQPMCGLVGEDVQADVAPRHQQERQQVRPPRVDHGGRDHDTERLQQRRDDGDDVAPVRDPAQLVAQLTGRLGAGVEPLGRQHIGKRLGWWNKIGGWRRSRWPSPHVTLRDRREQFR